MSDRSNPHLQRDTTPGDRGIPGPPTPARRPGPEPEDLDRLLGNVSPDIEDLERFAGVRSGPRRGPVRGR